MGVLDGEGEDYVDGDGRADIVSLVRGCCDGREAKEAVRGRGRRRQR